MRVKELIAELAKHDPDAVVFGYSYMEEADFLVDAVKDVPEDPEARRYCKGDSAIPSICKGVYLVGG